MNPFAQKQTAEAVCLPWHNPKANKYGFLPLPIFYSRFGMITYSMDLYHRLKKDLWHCKEKKLSYIDEVESCFQISCRYWDCIRKKLESYEFQNEEEETRFFKGIKPKITSRIELYSLLYHSILFEPEDPESAFNFWMVEYRRFEKFKLENKSFLDCFFTDSCELTKYYFLRMYFTVGTPNMRMYDSESTATNGDSMVAMLFALRLIQNYARRRLFELGSG